MCPSAVQSELLYFFYFLNFSSLCARHRHPAWSGPVSSQRCLHSDGHHLWSGWHRGIPHSVGSHSCFALSSHVCHQRHLRSVICNVSHYSLWVKLPITEVIFLSSMNEVIVSPICVSTNHRSTQCLIYSRVIHIYHVYISKNNCNYRHEYWCFLIQSESHEPVILCTSWLDAGCFN